GGHLVSFVGARDGAKLKLRAVVPFYAPNDLEAMVTAADQTAGAQTWLFRTLAQRALKSLLDFTEPNAEAVRRMREASPITYVKKGMLPFLLIHGTSDAVVPFHQATLMCDKMAQAGASCEIFRVEGGAHGMGSWDGNPAMQGYKVKMIEWLKQTMR